MASTHPAHRILAVDVGLRRTGIALSDESRTLACPLETVSLAKRELVRHLLELIHVHDVDRVVIGLPRQASGDEGEVAALARDIGARLGHAAGVAVVFQDEALTSWEARQILRERGTGRSSASRRDATPAGRRTRRTQRGEVDRLAAALILQEYLDAQRPAAGPGSAPGGAADDREADA
jgi:putative Holliday junction resolvase